MIFIPHNVPSLKNSRQMVVLHKKQQAQRILNLPSKTVKKYLQKIGIQAYNSSKGTVKEYKRRPNLFKLAVGDYFKDVPVPCVLGFHFVRDSRRRFDYINAMALICDLLTAHKYIVDDDCDHLVTQCMQIEGRWYTVNKKKPGVWLRILKEA